MNEETRPSERHEPDPGTGLNRRQLIQRGAVVAGALSAPVVIDSLTVSASADTSPSAPPNTVLVDTANGIDPGPVRIPRDR